MLKKYSILFGIIVAITLLVIATTFYPGGSLHDKNATGWSWQYNFISNLFGTKAVNGMDNPSRPWAVGGMFFLSICFMLFFIQFAKKIPAKGSSNIIKYFGIAGMLCVFLVVTPYHDIMITISSTLVLVSIFYITIFVLKSTLLLFKILCVVCMLVLYFALYMYGSGNFLSVLPTMQKIALVIAVVWVLCLHYFTKADDFMATKEKRTERMGK